MSTDQSAIIKMVHALMTSQPGRFYYKLQCKHPQYNWCDWMPGNVLKKFTFIEDARAEIKQCKAKDMPVNTDEWRILFCAEITEIVG